jgi:hypothetical protein
MKLLFEIFLTAHGLLHLPAFMRAHFYPEPNSTLSKRAGFFWLMAALSFFVSAGMLQYDNYYWWVSCCIAICLSQFNILLHWKETKSGTLVNLLIVVITLNIVSHT